MDKAKLSLSHLSRFWGLAQHLLTPPLDLKERTKRLGAVGRISFTPAETLGATLAVLPGSVTPFATFNDRQRREKAAPGERMRQAETVSAHAQVNTATTTIAIADLLKLLVHSGDRPHWCTLPLKAAA